MLRDRGVSQGRERAEELAVSALTFLAARPDPLARFLSLTGIGPGTLRQAAADAGFLGGVLDFLMADESLLLEFAAEAGIPADRIGRARGLLPGGAQE